MRRAFLRWVNLTLLLILAGSLNHAWADDGFYVVAVGKKAKKTILVSPQSTATASGTALLDAVNGIIGASATNRYLVIIEPGIYDIGANSLKMKSYVDIQGSGENVTKITGNVDDYRSGVVQGASNAELRLVTVEHTGGGSDALAIYNYYSSLQMTNVTAVASGAEHNIGIGNYWGSPTMTHVRATALGGNTSYGINNYISSSSMANVTATGSGAANENAGVYNNYCSPQMANVNAIAADGTKNYGVYSYDCPTAEQMTMTVVTAEASGGGTNYGIYNRKCSPSMFSVKANASYGTTNYGVENIQSAATLIGVTATAVGGTSSYGVENYDNSEVKMIHLVATATGGSDNFGVYNTFDSHVSIDQSVLTGEPYAVYVSSNSSASVGNTRLVAGIFRTVAGGVSKCAGVFDSSYNLYVGPACP